MSRDKRLRNITRVDYERKHQHGWWVRIHREGQMIQKFFSDSVCGGETRALREAKIHRDELLRLYPKPERGNMFNKTNARNKSGYAGIHKTRSAKRGIYYEVWQAGWVLPNGKRVNRKFHYSLDGRSEKEALQLAIKARKEGLRMIKKMADDKREKQQARKATRSAKKTRK
ncbi:MAG: hypothetical protein ABR577_15910 [Pyrinomonadaceae bacterium]